MRIEGGVFLVVFPKYLNTVLHFLNQQNKTKAVLTSELLVGKQFRSNTRRDTKGLEIVRERSEIG